MNLILKTKIRDTTKEYVMAGFTRDFFLRLAPPFPKLKLLRFDGSEKGNEIHIEMNLLIYKKIWVSLVTEHGERENELYFTDEGATLPPPLKYWKHRHKIFQSGSDVVIEDNVTYNSSSKILDILLFPFFYLLFFYRKPIYKKHFKGKK